MTLIAPRNRIFEGIDLDLCAIALRRYVMQGKKIRQFQFRFTFLARLAPEFIQIIDVEL